jgi:hypothetical protein
MCQIRQSLQINSYVTGDIKSNNRIGIFLMYNIMEENGYRKFYHSHVNGKQQIP